MTRKVFCESAGRHGWLVFFWCIGFLEEGQAFSLQVHRCCVLNHPCADLVESSLKVSGLDPAVAVVPKGKKKPARPCFLGKWCKGG